VSDSRTGDEPRHRPHPLRRLHARMHANPVTGLLTKVVVTIVGVLVIVAGIVMLVAPGPGIVGMILGLAILATEWAFAERWMNGMKEYAAQAAERARGMDPEVRRRRLLLTGVTVVVIVGGVLGYLIAFGWPGFAVDGWDWAQARLGFLPELPGM
jgi:uncharacterized protein (TIGR02611 family)